MVAVDDHKPAFRSVSFDDGKDDIETIFRCIPFGGGKLYQWGYYPDHSTVLFTLHCLDGPAMIVNDQTAYWLRHGEHHREDGPAWIDRIRKKWYLNGRLHRLDGPAIMGVDGTAEWYLNGRLHRLDGPAAIGTNGTVEWAIDGGYTSLTGMLSDPRVSDEDKIIIRLKYGHLLANTRN